MAAKIRVLIVDDSEEVRRSLEALLPLAAAVEVVGLAGNGREAVELAGRLRPDVVLMDVEMPLMDGLEAARRMRSARLEARIVILSLHDSAAVRRRAQEAGADGFMVKGTPIETLAALLTGLHVGER